VPRPSGPPSHATVPPCRSAMRRTSARPSPMPRALVLTSGSNSRARTDGSMQVKAGNWPLYYFKNDAAPGDINGQDVGDVWYVVSPTGEPIEG